MFGKPKKTSDNISGNHSNGNISQNIYKQKEKQGSELLMSQSKKMFKVESTPN
jgi:hypothetical protein